MSAYPGYLRAGSGPVLVLVHGFLGGARQWEREIAHFSDRFDVIAPDLPGFGAAAHQPGRASIAGMAAAVFDLLDSLGVDRFILLGHSMGGMIAQEMAATRPQSVQRLVLYGTGPLGLMPDRFEPIPISQKRLRDEGIVRTSARIAATWFKNGSDAPAFQHIAEIGAEADISAAEAAFGAMAEWDGRAVLTRLTMPTLIVWGDADRSYRWPQVESLWTGLIDVRLSVIPGAAHAAHLEKPVLFLTTVEDFLSEVDAITT
ncbi:MAG: alpha/beta fold hydrolase [Paracoccaceae bacterium]